MFGINPITTTVVASLVLGVGCGVGGTPSEGSPIADPAPASAPLESHDHTAVPEEAAPAGDPPAHLNPVQNEMRLLQVAMNQTLVLLANGALEDIPPTIHGVHQARALTDAAIEAGHYVPPRNGSDLAGFVAADGAFHDELVRIVKAARAGDRSAASAAYAKAVVGCTSCHARYRPGF